MGSFFYNNVVLAIFFIKCMPVLEEVQRMGGKKKTIPKFRTEAEARDFLIDTV